jgi:hypothetical protein
VKIAFVAKNEDEVRYIESEIAALAIERGLSYIYVDIDDPEEHHIQAAEELGIFGD